jgi:hypothetical protein
MEYELKDQDEVAATLKFKRSFAIGESGDGGWTFKRGGFWPRIVVVRELDSDTELAVFTENKWKGGGTLELPTGRKYLTIHHFWQSNYEICTGDMKPLIHYKLGGILHPSRATLIEPGAANNPELPWLTLLGWYLVVMMLRDAARASAAAA